jgi:hypothetical protein
VTVPVTVTVPVPVTVTVTVTVPVPVTVTVPVPVTVTVTVPVPVPVTVTVTVPVPVKMERFNLSKILEVAMYRYRTDKETKEILKSITIVCDTREQENKHITDSFTKSKIPFITKKLDFGDYSFMIPENKELNILPHHFERHIVIERKNSLEELSNNFAQDRQRFEDELLRSGKTKLIVMVERGSITAIANKAYETELKPASFIATLLTFQFRYDVNFEFVIDRYSALFIYQTFYYYLREKIKEGMI